MSEPGAVDPQDALPGDVLPDALLLPIDSDVEIHPIEEDPAVIAAIEDETTVPGLDSDAY